MQFRAARRQFRDFMLENFPATPEFVANIDVDVRRLYHMRADQHSFQETVRITLQIITILEGAGLALVAIDRHQSRAGFTEHRTPFAAGRESSAPESTQGRVVEGF